MPIRGDLLLALLALVVADYDGQADAGNISYPHTDTIALKTTTNTPTRSPLPTVMYLPMLPVQEPADQCKAGNLRCICICSYAFFVLFRQIDCRRVCTRFLNVARCLVRSVTSLILCVRS